MNYSNLVFINCMGYEIQLFYFSINCVNYELQ